MADKRELLFSFLGKETISTAAKKAGAAVEKLGDEFKATGGAAEKLGDEFKATGGAAGKLDREMDVIKASLAELATEFARTDDAAQRIDLTKAMRSQQRELTRLVKAKKFLPDLAEVGAEAASGFAASFVARIGPMIARAPMGAMNPAFLAIGAPLAAGVATVVGAAVGGAIIGGVGIGGIAGGVALAGKDPAVKAAASRLGDDLSKMLGRASSAFVPETLDAIDKIRDRTMKMEGDFSRAFTSASKLVDPLLDGLFDAAENAMPGIVDALESAGPPIEAIADGARRIGEAVGDGLSELSEYADEGARALQLLFATMAVGVDVAFELVESFARLYGAGEILGAVMTGNVARVFELVTAEEHAKESSAELARQQEFLKQNLGASADAARGQASALDELATELRAQSDPMFGLIDAQSDLTQAKKDHTAAIKEHGRNSPQAQEALRKEALAAIALQSAVGTAAGTFNGQLTPAMRATLKAAGLTDKEIAELEAQFRTAKAAGEKFAKNYQATVTVKYREIGRAVPITNEFQSGIGGRASGGPVEAGKAYRVGEKGPEVVTFGQDGYVTDARKTAQMLGGKGRATGSYIGASSGVGAAGGINIYGDIHLPGVTDVHEFIDQLQKEARRRGGLGLN